MVPGYITTYLPFHIVELTRQKVLDPGYNVSGDSMNPDYDQKSCSFRFNYTTKGPNGGVVGMVKQKGMNVYQYYKTQTNGGGSIVGDIAFNEFSISNTVHVGSKAHLTGTSFKISCKLTGFHLIFVSENDNKITYKSDKLDDV